MIRKFRESQENFDIPIIVLTGLSKAQAELKSKEINPVYSWIKSESPLVETVEIIKEYLKQHTTTDVEED